MSTNNANSEPSGPKENLPNVEAPKSLSQKIVSYNIASEAFQNSAQYNPILAFKQKKEAVEVFSDAGVATTLVENKGKFDFMYKPYKGDWKTAIKDPKLVELVKSDTELQNSTLQDPKPGFLMTPEEKIRARAEGANKIETSALDTNGNPLATTSEPDNVGQPLTINLDEVTNSSPAAPMPTPGFLRTPEEIIRARQEDPAKRAEREARAKRQLEELMKDSQESVELAEAKLEARKSQSVEKLGKMGLFLKGLDAYKNMKPRNHLLMGALFAGLSVSTGGLTSVVTKSISAASYSRGFYQKMIKAEQEKNPDVKKGWVAVRAVGYGIITALATSELFSNIGEAVAESDTFSSAKESVKNWFGSLFSTAENATPATDAFDPTKINGLDLPSDTFDPTKVNGLDLPADYTTPEMISGLDLPADYKPPEMINGLDLPADYHDTAINGLDLPADYENQSTYTPEGQPEVMVLPEYTIKPGDNLTKIISEQVISTIPGAENLTPFQKENMIQNLLKLAEENKGEGFYQSINQFTDPNQIQPGKTLDLTALRSGLVNLPVAKFDMDTLLSHALKLQK